MLSDNLYKVPESRGYCRGHLSKKGGHPPGERKMSWKVMGSNLSFGKVFFTHEIIVKGYSYILDQNCLFFQPIYNYTFSFGILEFLNKIKEPRVGQKIF